ASRRRHTRSKRDWSSDVCSSDLLSEEMRILYVALTRAKEKLIITGFAKKEKIEKIEENTEKYEDLNIMLLQKAKSYLEWLMLIRSEERRVGKEGRNRGEKENEKK